MGRRHFCYERSGDHIDRLSRRREIPDVCRNLFFDSWTVGLDWMRYR